MNLSCFIPSWTIFSRRHINSQQPTEARLNYFQNDRCQLEHTENRNFNERIMKTTHTFTYTVCMSQLLNNKNVAVATPLPWFSFQFCSFCCCSHTIYINQPVVENCQWYWIFNGATCVWCAQKLLHALSVWTIAFDTNSFLVFFSL